MFRVLFVLLFISLLSIGCERVQTSAGSASWGRGFYVVTSLEKPVLSMPDPSIGVDISGVRVFESSTGTFYHRIRLMPNNSMAEARFQMLDLSINVLAKDKLGRCTNSLDANSHGHR